VADCDFPARGSLPKISFLSDYHTATLAPIYLIVVGFYWGSSAGSSRAGGTFYRARTSLRLAGVDWNFWPGGTDLGPKSSAKQLPWAANKNNAQQTKGVNRALGTRVDLRPGLIMQSENYRRRGKQPGAAMIFKCLKNEGRQRKTSFVQACVSVVLPFVKSILGIFDFMLWGSWEQKGSGTRTKVAEKNAGEIRALPPEIRPISAFPSL